MSGAASEPRLNLHKICRVAHTFSSSTSGSSAIVPDISLKKRTIPHNDSYDKNKPPGCTSKPLYNLASSTHISIAALLVLAP